MIVGVIGAPIVMGLPAWIIADMLCGLDIADEFVTIATPGVATYAGAYLSSKYPTARHTVILPYSRQKTTYWWVNGYRGHTALNLIETAGEAVWDSYLALVERVTKVVSFPKHQENHLDSRLDSVWLATKMAEELGKLDRATDCHILKGLTSYV